jgi:hypothetical protein
LKSYKYLEIKTSPTKKKNISIKFISLKIDFPIELGGLEHTFALEENNG